MAGTNKAKKKMTDSGAGPSIGVHKVGGVKRNKDVGAARTTGANKGHAQK